MQMLSEKTVVYITHQLEFLDAADIVLVIIRYHIDQFFELIIKIIFDKWLMNYLSFL